MNRWLIGVCVWLGLCGLSLDDVLAHPHNSSIGSADWISDSNSLEVALKVSADDLEEVLSKAHKRPVRLDRPDDEAAAKFLKAYVFEHVKIVDAEGKAVAVKWIGHEMVEADAWLYFEFTFPGPSMKGFTMSQGLLVEAYDQQINFVNLKKGKRSKTLKFDRRRKTHRLPNL